MCFVLVWLTGMQRFESNAIQLYAFFFKLSFSLQIQIVLRFNLVTSSYSSLSLHCNEKKDEQEEEETGIKSQEIT